ncbi:hypothetical protein [Clostridium sp. YIM B02551]|nr:hypothetical protein [Clostridium sp. YIM B02551]
MIDFLFSWKSYVMLDKPWLLPLLLLVLSISLSTFTIMREKRNNT